MRLQIHHINGIHTDNRLENLQILCPNCHTQTDTYAANNKNKVKSNGFRVLKRKNEILNNEISTFKEKDITKVEIKEKNKTIKKCSVCGKEFVNDNGKYCSLKCAYIGHKKFDINSEQLIEDIKTLRSFFDTISKSLDEAARIDGATRAQVLTKIILPLSKPIVIYTILTGFMGPWGDFVFARYVSQLKPLGMNVAVGLQSWLATDTMTFNNYTLFCAGGVVVALPVALLFMFLQKYYVEGVTGGAVKG
ncbi:MAG: ABC transporter permease subunit [Alphaproteobacteria bacterium]|nr:ABC transporter permease subunit [Alphaproteobacteria bacterium]